MADYVIPSGAAGGNTAGDIHWKAPVADLASLPVASNSAGDARVTLDTSDIYIWTGAAWVSSTAGAIALTSAHLLVGSAANVATDVAVTGDISITNAGVTAIASDVIVNTDVKSDAAIALTKLATLSGASKLLGAGSAGATTPAEITLGTNLSMSGTTINAAGGSGLAQGAIMQLFAESPSNYSDPSGVNAGALTVTVVNTAGNNVLTVSADCREYVKQYSVVGTAAQAGKAAFVNSVSADGLTITCSGIGEDNPLATDAVASQLKIYGNPILMNGNPDQSVTSIIYSTPDGTAHIEGHGYWTGPMFAAGSWTQFGGTITGYVIPSSGGVPLLITAITSHALVTAPVTSMGTAPTAASDPGVKGQVAQDGTWWYLCTATNTWVRGALVMATW